MIVNLVDGTCELFRHFDGARRASKGEDRPFGAATGALNGLLEMIESDATHVGVATDHVIESFRNLLRCLRAQQTPGQPASPASPW